MIIVMISTITYIIFMIIPKIIWIFYYQHHHQCIIAITLSAMAPASGNPCLLERKYCQQSAGCWQGKCLWGSHSVASHQAVIRNALHLVPTNHWLYCLRVPKHVRPPPSPRPLARSPSSLSLFLLPSTFHIQTTAVAEAEF